MIKKFKHMVETKQKLTTHALKNANTLGDLTYLTDIDRGAGGTERVGAKIFAKNMTIRGYISNKNGTAQDCMVRVMIIRYNTYNDSTTYSPYDILTAINVNAMYDWDAKRKISVLYDQTYGIDTGLHSYIPFKIRLSKLNRSINYNATGGGTGDMRSGGMFMLILSSVTGTDDCPQVQITSRVTYQDS